MCNGIGSGTSLCLQPCGWHICVEFIASTYYARSGSGKRHGHDTSIYGIGLGQFNYNGNANGSRMCGHSTDIYDNGKSHTCGTDSNVASELLCRCSGSSIDSDTVSRRYVSMVGHRIDRRHVECYSTDPIDSNSGRYYILCKPNGIGLRECKSTDSGECYSFT